MNAKLLKRAARAVVEATDWEATFYIAAASVENWALDALLEVLDENDNRATILLYTYEGTEWEEGRFPRSRYTSNLDFAEAKRWLEAGRPEDEPCRAPGCTEDPNNGDGWCCYCKSCADRKGVLR